MKFIFVHGFNSPYEAQAAFVNLRNQFVSQGRDLFIFDYDRLGIIGVRFANKNLAATLLSFVRAISAVHGEPITLIGHSNGCALIRRALEAAELGLVDHAVFLSPALNRTATMPHGPRRYDVLFSGKDRATAISAFLPWHEWGSMGNKGYKGDDPRVKNHNYTGVIAHHSDWFLDCGWLTDTILDLENPK